MTREERAPASDANGSPFEASLLVSAAATLASIVRSDLERDVGFSPDYRAWLEERRVLAL